MNKFFSTSIHYILLSFLVSCGNTGQENAFIQNAASTSSVKEIKSANVVIDLIDIDPGLACTNGGISLFTFLDQNGDQLFQEEETIVKSKAICHGENGTHSSVSLETIVNSPTCPNGGVKISTSSSSPVEVCNGSQGQQGQQGIQGIQGLQGLQGVAGIAGVSGTQVIPVKFCVTDNSQFPEYGLMIGSELFAVFWGTTPASPTVPQAYLSKILAGQYMSTGGNGCIFSVP